MIDRRRFLGSSAALGMGSAFPPAPAALEPSRIPSGRGLRASLA